MTTSRHEELKKAYEEYNKQNPEIWTLFKSFADQRMSIGFSHYSVNAIFELIRWHFDTANEDGLSAFKLNNNHRPFYARRYNNRVGSNFFRIRAQKSREQEPTNMPPLTPEDFPYLNQ